MQRGTGILGYFATHRTAANLLLVLILTAGVHAITQIRAQYFPDVVIEGVTVSVAWDGAGAEDVDRAIVQVIEPALLVLNGVTDALSRATEGRAVIELEFEPGFDVARATEDVQTAVNGIRNLPEAADDPVVRRNIWRDRVTDVVLHGPLAPEQLGRLADELVARLFENGVTRTGIEGIAAPETVVEVTTISLIRHDVTMAEIAAAIGAEVQAEPAGEVGSGTSRVRTGAPRRSADDIAAIVLRTGADGAPLRIGDVGHVRVEGVARSRAMYVGANPAVVVRVDRADQGDAIRLQATVAGVVADLQTTLPAGVTVELVRTRAEQISDRLALLVDNGLQGLAIVIVLLFLFLNVRTAFWVAAGIPVAMLGALAIMYATGLTLNMMSLFALIITSGIVVDDAIVMGEHADYRARVLGEPPQVAAGNAARRMAGPIVASTMTTIIAFFGLLAIGGRFGELIAAIPLTVIAVMLASLVECFLILPNHMAHALEGSAKQRWYDWPSRQMNRGFDWFSARVFRPVMVLVVAARYPVLALAVMALVSQLATFVRGDLQWRFFNSPEQGTVSGSFAMLPGATRDDSLAMMRELQRAADVLGERLAAEHRVNPVAHVMAEVGGGAGRSLAGADTKGPDLLGGISIELVDPDLRPFSSNEFVTMLQDEVVSHPRLEELSFRGFRAGPGGDALSVDLYGADSDALKAAANAVKAALAAFPEVSGLEDSLAYDKEELILTLTAQGQALGISVEDLGTTLRQRLNGIEAATYPDGARSATIRVELPEAERTADFLDRMLMRTAAGQYVPLADVVAAERVSGFSAVRRENGLRLVTVSGDIAEDDPARATEVQRALREDILPRVAEDHGVGFRLSGLAQQEAAFLGDAGFGFALCLVGIYLCLSWIFASWTRPLVVMAVIPFGLVGAFWGHVHWNVPLSLFSVVGLIGMSGVIVNDAIVLVTTVDEYRAERPLNTAIVDGATDRLRAVFLTSATTVLGLAPMLYERSAQAAFLQPTVITLVYGLGFGVLLVLMVVPALMAVEGDIARAMTALRRMRARRAGWAQVVLGVAALAMLALFGATLGLVLAGGAIPLLAPGTGAALALFMAGAAVIAFGAFVTGAVMILRQRGARPPRPALPPA